MKNNKTTQEPVQENTVEIAENTQPEKTSEQQLEELRDSYLRMAAEYDNYRKRTQKTISDMGNAAVEKLTVDILPVLDDFARMKKYIDELEVGPDTSDDSMQMGQIIAGVVPIADKLQAALTKHNVTKIEINKGDAFDVDTQEAVAVVPAGSEMTNKVIDVTLDGYKHGDKIIRFAKVVVGQ